MTERMTAEEAERAPARRSLGVERLARWALGATSLIAVLLLVLAFSTSADELLASVRALIALSLAAVGVWLLRGPHGLDDTGARLRHGGLLRRRAVPFFRGELTSDGARRLGTLHRRRLPVRFLLVLVGPLVLSSVVLFAVSWHRADRGDVTVTEGAVAEAYRAMQAGVAYEKNLGFRLQLQSLDEVQDGVWRADVRAETASGTPIGDETLAIGERIALGDFDVALSGVRPLPAIGSVVIAVADRSTGTTERVRLRRGQRAEALGSEWELVEQTPNYLGQLGPAVEVAELRDGREVRRDWIFEIDPAFDDAHGVSDSIVRWVDSEPLYGATLSVRPAGADRLLWAGLAIISVWLLGLLRLLRPAPLVAGRDGDYVVAVAGASKREAVDRLVEEEILGTEPLITEWRTVLRRMETLQDGEVPS